MKTDRLSIFKISAIVAVVTLLALIPWIFNPYYTTIAIIIGIYTIITVGLCLLMGYTGQISLGQAAFYGIGAYISAILSLRTGLSPWLAMIIAAVATGTFAYLIGSRFSGSGETTWRCQRSVSALSPLLFSGRRIVSPAASRVFRLCLIYPSLGLSSTPTASIITWSGFLPCLFLLFRRTRKFPNGRALRAIRDSATAAESVGINVPELKVRVFTLSAVYASIAGSLYVHYLTYVGPQPFDYTFSIRLLLMAVVGGLASIWLAIFGTTAISFLGDALHSFGDLESIVFGFILMVIIIFMPQGLWVHFVAVYKERRDKAGKVRP